MTTDLKVGFCVAYDWYLLEYALPLIYDDVTSICLSIDKDKLTWSHEAYELDEEKFLKLIEKIDQKRKIVLYRDNFHLPALSPMENEVRQRHLMAAFMGPGGWHIQLDCDEYFLDFKGFAEFLNNLRVPTARKLNVCCSFITLFKRTDEGFFYIDPVKKKNLEFMQIATRDPAYQHGRRNGYFNVYTNFKILHQSWARSEHEIEQKLNNWGHALDFDHRTYFGKWKWLEMGNYHQIKDFHPLKPELWPALNYVAARDIPELMDGFKKIRIIKLSFIDRFIKNSRILSKLKSLIIRP